MGPRSPRLRSSALPLTSPRNGRGRRGSFLERVSRSVPSPRGTARSRIDERTTAHSGQPQAKGPAEPEAPPVVNIQTLWVLSAPHPDGGARAGGRIPVLFALPGEPSL